MNAFFYDIESLQNVFTLCNFRENDNIVDVYVLCDNPELLDTPTLETDVSEAVLAANRNFNGTIRFFDLKQKAANLHLAEAFGLSDAWMVNDPDSYDEYKKHFRLVCDTDPEYQGHEDEYPYLFGYNSYNYDTTMLALYLSDALMSRPGKKFKVEFNNLMKASEMRKYNDSLFTPRFKPNMPSYLAYVNDEKGPPDYNTAQWRIRKNMILSGRHLDVARLNEKQQHVALKRLLGMLGFQILESDKLSGQDITIETYEQLLDLLAYNASDVINLAKLFQQKVYKSNFALKRGLLRTYPELIYEQKGATYKPNIDPKHVRRDRLTIDSSSAQFATKALCPYGHLTDIPAVSFMYPSERIARERGIPRRNILEETRTFFYQNFPQPELRREFDRIYNYYKSIEGRNFNESRNYQEDFAYDKPLGSQFVKAESISSVAETNTCLFYYNEDGTPSSCFVTFSTGGIHGAEYNKKLWEHDCQVYEQDLKLMAEVQKQYPNPIDLKKAKTVTIDGRSYAAKKFLTSKSTLKSAEYRDFSAKRPELFKEKQNGGVKLNEKYTFTSADPTNHEDFTSYYPNLLIAMAAFYNTQLGYDRYDEIFQNKQRFGRLMKDKSLSEAEREDYAVQREGTKLVLNSASGAGDATFESNIRMNNQIISMRIIGQLFSYRIGQAQTLAGAKITSTNTDGLYSVLEKTVNDLILEREAATISVEIEPEPMYLISKDSNNRIEMNPATGEILNASGGSLACRERPNPTKSLSHPAILDWALTEYLIISALNYKNLSLATPFDRTIGMNILKAAEKTFTDRVHFLLMFQNVLASSTGSVSYVFGLKDGDETPIIMQHYNRVFILKDNTPGTMHLQTANARVITPLTARKRAKNDEAPRQPDPLAQYVLEQNGISMKDIPENKEPIVKKITNVGPDWSMFIQNKDLNLLSDEEFAFIKDNLDYDKYLDLFQNAFEESWRNEDPVLDQE